MWSASKWSKHAFGSRVRSWWGACVCLWPTRVSVYADKLTKFGGCGDQEKSRLFSWYSDRWVSLKLIQFWKLRNSEGMLGNQEMKNVPIALPGRKVFKIDGRLVSVARWPCQETVDACPSISRPNHPPNPWSRGAGRWDHRHSQKQRSYKEYNETKLTKIGPWDEIVTVSSLCSMTQ